jgi:uncharacterized protein YdaU (DUF1376 family)
MAQYPVMPVFTDAYLADTTHLTTIEHGAYFLLIMAMWRAGGSLPGDHKSLARYARLTAGQWARIWPSLEGFFDQKDGKIYQGRLTDELEAVRQHRAKQSDRSKARWLKTNKTGNATGMPDECRGNAIPSPSTSYIEKKDKTELNNTLTDPVGGDASDAGCVSDFDDDQKSVSDHVETRAEKARQMDAEFEVWWQLVPLKKAKGGAKTAFGRARKLASLDVLSSSMQRYAAECAGREDRYVAHPATWLNQQRWLDEPAKTNGARHNGNGYDHGQRTESALDYCLRKSGFGSDLEEDSIPH